MLILQSPPGDFCPFLRVQDETEGWQTREGRMKVRTEGGSTPRSPAIHFLQKSPGRMLASGVDLWWYPWQWVDRESRCSWAAAGHDDFGIIGGRWSLGGGGDKKKRPLENHLESEISYWESTGAKYPTIYLPPFFPLPPFRSSSSCSSGPWELSIEAEV